MHPGQETTEVSGADKGAASNIRKIRKYLLRRAAETVVHTLVMSTLEKMASLYHLVFLNTLNTSFRSSSMCIEWREDICFNSVIQFYHILTFVTFSSAFYTVIHVC